MVVVARVVGCGGVWWGAGWGAVWGGVVQVGYYVLI